VGLTYIRPLAPKWTLETRVIHQFEHFDERLASGSETEGGVKDAQQRFTVAEGDSSETIVRALVRHERTANLTIEAGGEVAYNMLDTQQAYAGRRQGGRPAQRFGQGRGAARRGLHQGDLAGQSEADPGGRPAAGDLDDQAVGRRLQRGELLLRQAPLPATWTPKANHQVRFRFERELGQLDFGDFAASSDLDDGNVYGGNVDLKPEQRWISEITFERRFWGEGIVSIGYRHDEIIDVIDRLPLPAACRPPATSATARWTAVGQHRGPDRQVGDQGRPLHLQERLERDPRHRPDHRQDRPISGVRPTQANIGFQQDITAWKTQWGINWLPLLGQGTYDVGPDQRLARLGLFRELRGIQADPDPVAARPAEHLGRLRHPPHGLFRPRDPGGEVHEERDINPRTFVSLRVRKTF
jgi:hypothetical protein